MSVPKLISPMLDNFNMGDPISAHNGVCCCPAMEKHSDAKYMVKIISVPSSPAQLEALLLSGAYPNAEAAREYFKTVTDGILAENRLLEKLSQMDGFVPFENCQIEPMEDGTGFDVYLLSAYNVTLQRHMRNSSMTQLEALNLGLDLCSALSICRQSGYLYTNLKPENIYITAERGYRIGDLGFLKLNSLKYASLPDRYRSAYTAPEIADAYSELNTTIDVYAIGLVLYQVYNNGQLPFSGDAATAEVFPAPAFADYEMTEIILKACAPDPADRYQDPESMGQALVAYMQRNGANDVPIMPVADVVPTPEDPDDVVGSFEAVASDGDDTADSDANEEPEEADVPVLESDIYAEDANGNLTFLTDDDADETLPDEVTANIPDAVVTEEVSDMLQQADELIAHPAPEPVIPPEPIDVPIPEPVIDEPEEAPEPEVEETAEDVESEDTGSEETNVEDTLTEEESRDEAAPSDEDDNENQPEDEADEETDYEEAHSPRKHTKWIWILVLTCIALGLLTAGTFFYRNYYLQHIRSVTLKEAGEGVLTVFVDTDTDESLLTVVYTDTYGVQSDSFPVKDGKSVLTDLSPDTKYTIKVQIDGYHKLTGEYTKNYTSPSKITVSEFTAEAGTRDGEILLHFETDAPDSAQWFVSYTSDNGTVKEESATDNSVTVGGLTVGNTYTFILKSPDADYLVGQTEVSYTARAFIQAENLTVTGCINNRLRLEWSAPANSTVTGWTVRCTGANGFSEAKTVTETSAEFTVPDDQLSYSLEVTAEDMSRGVTTRSPANTVTITDLKVDESDPTRLTVTWAAYGNIPVDGWTLNYTIDGMPQSPVQTAEAAAEIFPLVPNCQYSIVVEPVGDIPVLGGTMEYTAPVVTDFEGYGIQAADMIFTICSRPESGDWNRHSIKEADKRSEFTPEESIGFLVKTNSTYNPLEDEIVILYVIRDQEGMPIDVSTETAVWSDMWSRGNCVLNAPNTPQGSGDYVIEIYFNGSHVTDVTFTITN